ncbi:hypothetical protein Poli38472_004398 [Pythium oligandrum]|uniref:FAR1 domain-containing protein n=1 Tax=Pythium oligandrum TaxID=41045 RepID=A0A8K1CA79_PYTOL|nr:hypothetical protein Poli38472_004398 [Pythium oligandrum]|eukprot:TMW59329.1 hypothetical protein Poli38472_004398 [Pythium oligandrum]
MASGSEATAFRADAAALAASGVSYGVVGEEAAYGGDVGAQHREEARDMVDGDDPDETQEPLVRAPQMERIIFSSWEEFDHFLAEHCKRTYQHFVVGTSTPVETRNKRIGESYTKRGVRVDPYKLIPAYLKTYSKTLKCTHGGKPRSRSKGLRPNQKTRAMNCPAKVNALVRKLGDEWRVVVSTQIMEHSHPIGPEEYARLPSNRRIDDPVILKTLRFMLKNNTSRRSMLEYLHEVTDKPVKMKDVHNLVQRLMKEQGDGAPLKDGNNPSLGESYGENEGTSS